MTKRRMRRFRRSASRRPRAIPSASSLEVFLRETAPPDGIARALRAALPGGEVPGPSAWLESGLHRARRASGLTSAEALGALASLVAWAYRRDAPAQLDLALTLAQIELVRRKQGLPSRVITLPPAPPDAPCEPQEVEGVIAHWEAASYAAGLVDPREDPVLAELCTHQVVSFLARTDGLPVRFEALDPEAFLESLVALPAELEGCPRPEAFAGFLLDSAAEIYSRLIGRVPVAPAVMARLAERLRTLASVVAGDAEVAVA